ncbi:MAG: hypothetical protein AEth_01556 [Candidatus Argoarchaeum ethanivorans]|uniref:Uncharacterized protein n=1 Tax=Candidatus Argoarchaeum ethanivorans TaxID=2608793 RepID=A0A8B3S0D3_9EURY|nr:MAG: hypothetical protein AEth_01556 [Candidatus Argoarchaeum ethanivorans]
MPAPQGLVVHLITPTISKFWINYVCVVVNSPGVGAHYRKIHAETPVSSF